MVKVGDIVRYLNSVGGGKVMRVDGNTVYVDDDGFETPILARECVVIETIRTKANAYTNPKPSSPSKYIEPEKPKEMPVIETQEGNLINVVLAYESANLKNLSSSPIDTYLVNDSNYFLYFAYMSKGDDGWITRFHGIVEPNIQVHLGAIKHTDLAQISRVAVQYIPFKQGKPFALKNPVMVEHRLDTTKFYKLHCFQQNEYFDNPVIALPIVKNDIPFRQLEIDTRELEKAIKIKEQADKTSKKVVTKHVKPQNEVIECDLHITQLLDTTAGLSNFEMLEVQLKEFNRVMEENIRNKGAKIVFIHGKGEGVLRKALFEELKKKYKSCAAQDASFREYGFGATLITIH